MPVTSSHEPLRVAVVHSYYVSRNPSGENRVVDNEVAALRAAGHDVTLIAEHTDELEQQRGYRVRSALRVATGAGRDPLQRIAACAPDVVHVHNTFPNLGRRWADEVRQPLVTTLHNYRPLCAAATLFRDGHVCTLCPDGDRLAGLRYACYRDSRVATLPLTIANLGGAGRDPLLRRADRVVALSERMRGLYAADGVPRERIVVWPNFLPDDADPRPGTGGTDWVVVGRLTPEKGILELVRRWPAGHRLRVVGDGEQLPAIRQAAGPDVEVLGRRPHGEVVAVMRDSVGLVLPSRWFEGFPLVYVEAMAAGLPVLALTPNVGAELVATDGTGVALAREAELASALAAAERDFPHLRARCRAVFEQRYTQAAYVQRATQLYRELIAAGRAGPARP